MPPLVRVRGTMLGMERVKLDEETIPIGTHSEKGRREMTQCSQLLNGCSAMTAS